MTPPPALIRALADRYRIERELGQGGMATVYLAQDLKHDRKVAIKVLRPELAAVIGADRFLAEIKTTANLQHPHILPLHDSGEVNGTVFYVMPFVEGESLRDRLTRERQLPVDDAVRLAREVADALGYAHGQGIVHRDIKPENILLHGGHAMVADFGIALAASRTDGGARMTETGMSLGTPHYMSPEQAMGERTLDARTDIYALGCVVYEMLAGEPPFTGPTAQAIVARVMTEEPRPLGAQRKTVPEHVEAAVEVALAKLPADRFATAGDFGAALGGATTGPRRRSPRPARAANGAHWRVAAASVLFAAAAAAMGWWLGRLPGGAPASDQVARFELNTRPRFNGQSGQVLGGIRLAWSPDGKAFAYVGGDSATQQIYLRSLDAFEGVPVAGTTDGSSPFFSPDGSELGFIRTTPFGLKVVPRAGGGIRDVVTGGLAERRGEPGLSGGGAAWAADGYIYFDGGNELARIRPDGTGRERVMALDSTQQDAGLAWPQVLPGGHAVLFRMRRTGDGLGRYGIWALDLATHERHEVVKGLVARYAAPGFLVYITGDGVLMAARFDPRRLVVVGAAVTVATGLDLGLFGSADLGVSSQGDLLYTIGRRRMTGSPALVDRQGHATPIDSAWHSNSLAMSGFSLSPDGRRLAVEGRGDMSSGLVRDAVWVKELPAGPLLAVTRGEDQSVAPVWSADGKSLLFISSRGGPPALYRQRADGSGEAVKVAEDNRPLAHALESADGRWILVQTAPDTPGDGDILALRLGVDTVPKPLLNSPAAETNPSLSLDGNWLAYVSNETGSAEVYVRPFPDVGSGRWQVSTSGGSLPKWSRRGDELFWRGAGGEMMVATIRTTGGFGASGQRRLFLNPASAPAYDVTPDGKAFVMLASIDQGIGETRIVLVQNFVADLKKRLP